MTRTLHVLNGDSTAKILENSKIKGDVIVWRELLCDGPLHTNVGSDEFWTKRYAFFKNELGVERLEYFDKTIKEIVKLEDVSNYNEVILWFEFDLFCQVNLLALCTYLLDKYVKKTNYYLVCVGKENGKDKLQSLADYSPEEYRNLYENKISLSKTSLEYAKECWSVYVESSFEKLKSFDFNQSSKFKYLQLAINQHLNRFPSENGLNQIENKILKTINSNSFSEIEIVKNLLIWQQEETVYGFGDMQYFQYLNKLEKYYTIKEEKYLLNENGYSKINQ
ncbi:MAG: DUF1835 domain-containing protein [Lutibacter sp.]|uniref:DUF1835 domain-containing protein n=1 Tax=Lutibacter sp. TaxID=1925666 RepID=UPI0019F876B1|nr:DUF1835 domain-containing protein [Lutibacter sp.]NOR29154.1 DUF1835 domain-containing protein [Lutibacter sp.]